MIGLSRARKGYEDSDESSDPLQNFAKKIRTYPFELLLYGYPQWS